MNNFSNEKKYRHEQKYLCKQGELINIENSIKSIMQKDIHADNGGKYNIRSVYFDDYWDSCYFDNENGVNPREKFRIRIYNYSKELIKLELKRKENGKTYKESCLLDYDICNRIIQAKKIPYIEGADPLYVKLYHAYETRRMIPKVIVEYERKVYVYKYGNVRITFDEKISSSEKIDQLFQMQIAKRPIMPMGLCVLEVKYNEFLPDIIYRSLQKGYLRETTFSKYYYCRKFSLG